MGILDDDYLNSVGNTSPKPTAQATTATGSKPTTIEQLAARMMGGDGCARPLPLGLLTRPAPRREHVLVQRVTDENGNPKSVPVYGPDNWIPLKGPDNKDLEQQETIGVLARGQFHILAGEGGAGKGRWLIGAALGVACGVSERDVCGLSVVKGDERERVLLVLGEDDEVDFHIRTEGVAQALVLDDKDDATLQRKLVFAPTYGLPFNICETPGDSGTPKPTAEFEWLRNWIVTNGPWSLIAIDPLSRFTGVDENDNNAQGEAMKFIESLCHVNGEGNRQPAVLAVDHTRKQGGQGPVAMNQHSVRGAGAKVNAARCVMILSKGGVKRLVDSEGRDPTQKGFSPGSGVADVFVGDARWSVEKTNARPANDVVLQFTSRGGLVQMTNEAIRLASKQKYARAMAAGELKKWTGQTPALSISTTPTTPPTPTQSALNLDGTASTPSTGSKRRRGAGGAGSSMTTTPSQAPIVSDATSNPWEGSNV